MFDHSDFMELAPSVDHFSMMTYDYSTSEGLPGPNAPLSWMAQTIMFLVQQDAQAMQWTSKLLLGFNFYGYDYVKNGGALLVLMAHRYLLLT
jgi:chitinase domain-containing protein 1